MKKIQIRKPDPEQLPDLLALWKRSVRATHDFLSASDIEEIQPEVAEALRLPDVWVAEEDGRAAGFMIMNGAMIEALFIDVPYRGKGVGGTFIRHARNRVGPGVDLLVDVNEQNPDAAGFYRAKGFRPIGRSDKDAAGRPFPILHLSMPASG